MNDPLCAYCSKPGPLHREHVVPRSRGGPDNATNIVMACGPCNSAKGTKLPSEWLGDRCPSAVLLIEIQVHTRLQKSFRHRDNPKAKTAESAPLYAIHVQSGIVKHIGRVVEENGSTLRVDLVDALFAIFGGWSETGELMDLPQAECRIFTSRKHCLEVADELMTENRERFQAEERAAASCETTR